MKIRGRLDPVVNIAPLELLNTWDAQAARLERADSRRNHHCSGQKPGARRGGDEKLAAIRGDFRDLLPQVEGGMERLCLLQQPVDQLLRTADGQRRNVVD